MLISLPFLVDKYSLDITGVIHVGAHHGQEYEMYSQYTEAPYMTFIEPCKAAFDVLHHRLHATGAVLVHAACGSAPGFLEMYTEQRNQGQSNSLLKPKGHLKQHPEIKFNSRETVQVITLDSITYKGDRANFLNMDVQGYELEVLKGSVKTLDNIHYIYTEVNKGEVYENCARIEDMDAFLMQHGFIRVELAPWVGDWSDAFYIKH